MKNILISLFLTVSIGVLAGCSTSEVKTPVTSASTTNTLEKMLLAKSDDDVGQCMGECASEQGICISQCDGNGQCISNCAAAHGRCVARCTQ